MNIERERPARAYRAHGLRHAVREVTEGRGLNVHRWSLRRLWLTLMLSVSVPVLLVLAGTPFSSPGFDFDDCGTLLRPRFDGIIPPTDPSAIAFKSGCEQAAQTRTLLLLGALGVVAVGTFAFALWIRHQRRDGAVRHG